MFIKRLEIVNFQAHKAFSTDFSPRLNAITGESDQGKSTILRAIRWVLVNKPDGQQYRRIGTRETTVAITLDSGVIISRVRSNTVNRYILELPGEDPKLFDSIGVKVPIEISEHFGPLIAHFGEDQEYELSITDQFDSSFLLRDSSGTRRAQVLGSLSKTTLLDSAGKIVGGETRNRGRHLKLVNEELERLNGELSKYDDLPRDAERIESLQGEVEQLKTLHSKMQRIAQIGNVVGKLDESITKRESRLEAFDKLPDVDALELAGAESIRATEIAGRLGSVIRSIPVTEKIVKRIDAILPEHVQALERAGEAYRRAQDFSERAGDWKKRYQTTVGDKARADSEFETKIKKLLELLGDLCPMCLGTVDEETKKKIAQELRE